jgi:hypothetical protein
MRAIASILDVKNVFTHAVATDLILCDIDDCLIAGVAHMFAKKPQDRFVDQAKMMSENEFLVGLWRLSRKVHLTASQWPNLLRAIQKKGASIYALTKMNPGNCGGAIKNVEQWRYDELQSLGIQFSSAFNEKKIFEIPKKTTVPGIFYKGIFMTGALSKGDVLAYILSIITPSSVIFIDDCSDHVADLAHICKEKEIPFTGMVFQGAQFIKRANIPVGWHEKIYRLQEQLFFQGKWMEDEEAFHYLLRQ